MADLQEVNQTLKEQNELLKGNRALEIENKREADRKQNELMKLLSGLKATVNINGEPADTSSSSSILTSILSGLGLIGAGAAGLAAGLAAGWLLYVGDLVKDIVKVLKGLIGGLTKSVIKVLDAIPRPKFVDDIIAAFKADGSIGQFFAKIKNFFIGEGSFFKRIGTVIDGVIDSLKGVTGGLFTKIKTFFVGEGTFFKRIGAVIDGVVDSIKGFTGGLFTKIKTFFVGETSIFKRIGAVVDTAVDAVKGFTGGIFTKIKNFFVGDTSVFKRIGTILDTTIETVKGFTGGFFTKISNFFTGETSIFKRIGKIADTTIETLKAFTGGAFDKIAAPFKWLRVNTTTGSIIGDLIDGVMDVFKTGAGEGGFISRIFRSIGNVFSSLKSIGTTLTAPFDAIKGVFGAVKGAGGGIIDTLMAFLNPFKGVFQTFARIGRVLAAPLSIIMGLFDAGFETKDAVEKSEGFFASLLNGLIGAVGGFIDGAVFQIADFIKDGISFIAGFFGFDEIEASLDSFSFSEIWNGLLDDVYKFVNTMFNNPMELIQPVIDFFKDFFSLDNLKKLVTSMIPGAGLISAGVDFITGGEDTPEERAAEVAELRAELERVKQRELAEGVLGIGEFTEEDRIEQIAQLNEQIAKIQSRAVGGIIPSAGLYNLHQGEMVLDNAAVAGFQRALNLVNMSQENAFLDNATVAAFQRALNLVNMSQENALAGMAGGGTPVIINNTSVDNSSSVNSRQSVTVPQPVRSGESTKAAFDLAYGA